MIRTLQPVQCSSRVVRMRAIRAGQEGVTCDHHDVTATVTRGVT